MDHPDLHSASWELVEVGSVTGHAIEELSRQINFSVKRPLRLQFRLQLFDGQSRSFRVGDAVAVGAECGQF